MTSLSGSKDRTVTSRSRKLAMPDTSPTKSSFFPDSWYRKHYEETARSGSRPPPEGAGSMPSSTGTPSPGSGISSPGSLSGSPGTISPGIGTGSPGSLGGSPGFGTGSPASGSGSSPGSERGIWCENCNARLSELKRQALKLLIPGPFSSKDPSFSLLLHDKLQVPNSSRRAWNEHDSRCDVCGTHLTQLKQEAVHMVLTLDHWDLSPPSSPPALTGRAAGSREWAPPFLPSSSSFRCASPSPNQTSAPSPSHGSPSVGQTGPSGTNPTPTVLGHKLGSKPSSLRLGSGLDRRNGSPSSGKLPGVQQQPGSGVNSPGQNNGGAPALGPAAQQLQNRPNGGVTLFPYQTPEGPREGPTEAALTPSSNTSSPSHTPAISTTAPAATSSAASFFARAAQKLNLTKKKKQKSAPPPVTSSPVPCDPQMFPTNFCSSLLKAPPPAPPCLLRAANKIKDTPGLGKVKVMVRVCPVSLSDVAESSSFLKVDPRKKQVTIMEPSATQTSTPQKRGGASQVPPKMFSFDAAFPPDASQAEVCAGTVAEVIQSVVNGADGCVFCFGHSKLGKSYTMIGRDDSLQTLGIIPCAISWLFKLINERKEKTGARFSVRVSAVEVSAPLGRLLTKSTNVRVCAQVWGKEENLKDLLSDVATGSLQDGQSPGVYLCEDPICGMQLQNQSELRAPTPEKAAWFLDAAIAARHGSRQADASEEEQRNSHMLFTLHIYQYRMEKTGKGGMSGGRSRLHLLDLGSCDARLLGTHASGKSKEPSGPGPAPLCLSLSALGNVILALVNGSKHIPYKDSKLTMLLRESLGNMNCRTTMIAHISASPRDFSETLSTIQLASRVLRMKKKKSKVTVYTSSSSGGESSCEEGRMRRPTHLRSFHHRGESDSDHPLLRLSSDPDEYSSSEQSCDTVIYVGPNGAAVSDRELTDNEGPPEFVPIIPALLRAKTEPHQNKAPSESEVQDQPAGAPAAQQCLLGQPLAPVPEEAAECLKCNTFAELQERLDCIDGSEEVAKFPFEELPAALHGAKPDPGPDSAPESRTGESVPLRFRTEPHMTPTWASSGSAGGPVSWGRSNDQQLQELQEVVEEAELAQTMIQSLTQGSPILTRNVTGSSTSNLLQRARSCQLTDSRESANLCGSAEGKARPLGSPRLGVASLTRTSDYRPPSSPSQRCKVYTQKGVIPATPPQTADPLTSDNSLAADSGRSSTESVLSRGSPVGVSPQAREPAPSLSASLGSAETLCEDDVPPLPLDPHREGPSAGVSGSSRAAGASLEEQNLSEDAGPTCRPPSEGPGTSTGVTEVVAMAEVAMARLRTDGNILPSAASFCGSSLSSWMSDLSVGSEADGPGGLQSCPGPGSLEEEKLERRDKLKKMPPSMAKTTIQSLTGVSVHSCVVLRPMSLPEPAILSPRKKPNMVQEPPPGSGSSFDDPWLKRGLDEQGEELQWGDQQSFSTEGLDPPSSGGGGVSSPDFGRVVDGCEMVSTRGDGGVALYDPDVHRTASLPRGWHQLNRHDGLDAAPECRSRGVASSTPCSPLATLDRRGSAGKLHSLKRGGVPPLPPVRKSSLDQRNRAASPLHALVPDDAGPGSRRGSGVESSRLFSAKLEQLACRTNSLGRVHGSHGGAYHYDCLSLERGETLRGGRGDGSGPRSGRGLLRTGSVSSATGSTYHSLCSSAGTHSAPQSPAKTASQSKLSAVSKLLMTSGPKSRSLSASSTKTLSFSCKSLSQTGSRSSSLPPNGKAAGQNPAPPQGQTCASWSTQSLSRSRGGSLAAKLPLRAVNSRISELLQGSAGARSRGPGEASEAPGAAEEKTAAVQTLPSPYSKITAPRKPQRCSSGHASDNSSVLSGELPPAMGRTALFYHSGGSSGYESMLRDSSENTGSASSAQDSLSDHSTATAASRRSAKSSKKSRSNTGLQRRRLIPALTSDSSSSSTSHRSSKQAATSSSSSSSSPGACWVDGPLGPPTPTGLRAAAAAETFEIKVYEIDDVERLQRRKDRAGNKELVYVSAKLRLLENRQQRIGEVRARYQQLKTELEQTKQHLMLEPQTWTTEFELQQVYEGDSLEYLAALETVTDKLETRVNFCKAHLMMVTCFDVSSRHGQTRD
ncbi:LOW QUALITY PROTEIN: kinesin-like protein KIF26B [Neosynchiropus ocellatus]